MMTTSNDVFYTVELSSRFSGFLDDPLSSEDPTILLSKIQNERAEKRKEKFQQARERKTSTKSEAVATPIEADTNLVSESAATVDVPVTSYSGAMEPRQQSFQGLQQRGRGGRGRGPFRGYPRGPREPRQVSRVSAVEGEGEKEQRPTTFNPRGFRPRGRANFTPRFQRARGAGGPRGSSNRAFERKEVEPEEPTQTEEADRPTENGDDVEPKTDDIEEVRQTAPQPEEPVGYTLEEYKAMRTAAKAGTVQLESKVVRVPNDGKNVFANMVSHIKVVNDSEVPEEVPSTKTQEKVAEPAIDVTFGDRRGGRPSERGRGTFRGARATRGGPARGGRGFTRGSAGPAKFSGPAAPPPSINDDHEFPSLSK